MAEGFVNFFIQSLDSLLLQEAASFSGFEDELQRIMGMLREIGSFSAENESDRKKLIDGFRCELQKTDSSLAETVRSMKELNSSIEGETREDQNFHGVDEGETSAASSLKLQYANLPYHLQVCFAYCCIFPENYWINKGRLIRLFVAEGLILRKAGEVVEDIAQGNINELIDLGMLQVVDHPGNGIKLVVPSGYREVCLHKIKEESFSTTCPNSDSSLSLTVRCLSLHSDMKQVESVLNIVRRRSLFMFGKRSSSEDNGNWLNLYGSKLLRVLDLEDSKIKHLPDEVGDLMHLRYLGLKHTDISELPERLGNLRALQTLDIRWCGNLKAVPNGVLNLLRLRHFKMFKSKGVGGMNVPEGIGRLESLLTLVGVDAGGSIARELGNLIQLRRLGVMNATEDSVSELLVSVMKMRELLSLSLKAKHAFHQGRLTQLESFVPPPLLRKLHLEGVLEKIPDWLGLMERLTRVRLSFSHLTENPTSVLQLLPNLKILSLWHAFDAKQIGEEFCRAGGFPKLEDLTIASHVLEEWTELVEGALPSLKFLHLRNCLRLRMLPEGLQFITTLKQLTLLPLLDDHEERLRPL